VKITYRQEYVKCGKSGCNRCPHGPYWYGYWSDKGKTRKKYIGKTMHGSSKPTKAPASPHQHDAIFRRSTATEAIAKAILGIPPSSDVSTWTAAFKTATLANHPDRGGSNETMQRVIAAWSFLKARYKC
jgi:hypothetical protein